MQCPKCLGNMETLNFNDVEVDRCTACYGLFFDHLEKETLKEMAGSEVLDIGDEFLGATYNEILDAPCPRCRTRMNHVLHTEPFEIKFESCPNCKGTYFDAGEFKDYLEDEIYDQFQDVIENLHS
jgi:Zn-finger nucleic acid-binding protein